MAELPDEKSRVATGIRPRKRPAHTIPPCPAEADAGQTNEQRGDAGSKSAAPQVVVADDDNDLVQMLSQRLSALGCSVIGVNTTLDAVNVVHRKRPDLVILDVNMPTGSGLSVCEMMAADEQLRLIPAIVLTGCTDADTIRRCHEMLVFYVQKGADIWSRIDPLVRELLHLDDAPLAESAADEPNENGAEPLIDAVFAMLAADDEAAASAYGPTIETPWVLCIDDDADFVEALKIRFDEYGVEVARAASGMEGYRMAFSTPASAILLDYQMPNGQGDYILDRLKSNPVTQDIPVFMITGIKDKPLERRIAGLGAAGFFLKPVDFERLRRGLAEHIDALAKPVPRNGDEVSERLARYAIPRRVTA